MDASGITTGPDPSGSVQADTLNSGFVSPDKTSVENTVIQPESTLEATAATSSNTTTEDVLATDTTPLTLGSPKTYLSVAALGTQVNRNSTGASLPLNSTSVATTSTKAASVGGNTVRAGDH